MDEATDRRHIAWLRHLAAKSRALADEYDATADRREASRSPDGTSGPEERPEDTPDA
jgi:hypothetical protein